MEYERSWGQAGTRAQLGLGLGPGWNTSAARVRVWARLEHERSRLVEAEGGLVRLRDLIHTMPLDILVSTQNFAPDPPPRHVRSWQTAHLLKALGEASRVVTFIFSDKQNSGVQTHLKFGGFG